MGAINSYHEVALRSLWFLNTFVYTNWMNCLNKRQRIQSTFLVNAELWFFVIYSRFHQSCDQNKNIKQEWPSPQGTHLHPCHPQAGPTSKSKSNLMVWIDGTLDETCDLAFFAKLALIVGHTCWRNYKQLLDELFVISRIMEVEVGVISRKQRLRLITLTEISIILDITKSESNNAFIIHWTGKN